MATRIEPLMTIADLDAMPDDEYRYEIIEGELFVARSPSLTHQSVSGNLFMAYRRVVNPSALPLTHQSVSGNLFMSIKTFLLKTPIGEIWATPGVSLSEFNGVIPDLVYISHQRRAEIASGDRVTGAPDLVIEIVSPGSENERRDRVAKRQLYGKYGVKEYWIVDFEKRSIEIYQLRGHSMRLRARLNEQDEITSSVLAGYRCKVETIFAI